MEKWVQYVGYFLGVMVLLVAGCVGEKPDLPSPMSQDTGLTVGSYLLGPNDVIRIDVFGEDDLRTEAEVNGLGQIKFPLIGQISVQGMTVEQVEDYLTARLKDGYLKDPKVTVTIIRHRNIFVSGEVSRPGAYPYQDGLTVLKAVTLAGGFTERAARSRIKILRMMEGKEVVIAVQSEHPVQPDDMIIVPESFF